MRWVVVFSYFLPLGERQRADRILEIKSLAPCKAGIVAMKLQRKGFHWSGIAVWISPMTCDTLRDLGLNEGIQGAYMDAPQSHEVTGLLQAWSAGDEEALEKLTPLVYRELHGAARRYMAGEGSGHILQATALINEVYLRLIDDRRMDWQNWVHFFAVCAQLMRRILTDFARSRRYQKRGGGAAHIPLDEALVVGSQKDREVVELDEALLALVDERKSRVVELRFFGGLDVKETAQILNVFSETVMRNWRLAKVWLLRDLSGGKHHES